MDSRFPASRLRAVDLLILVSLVLASADAAGNDARCFSAIFSFGDSLADTGNMLHELYNVNDSTALVGHFPYGETYFRSPTGRFSDGRLIVDFIAQAMGHELLSPYFEGSRMSWECIKKGVNFAVGGATALNASFFEGKGIELSTNYSLNVQLEWMRRLQPSPTPSPPSEHESSESRKNFGNSLILLGEIGGNDYNYAFFQGRKLSEIESYVPQVVHAIVNAIHELIAMGARTFVVPGNLPLGCNPAYLTTFASERDDDYSDIGCLVWLNNFARHHNEVLQGQLRRLRETYGPEVTLIYADYYGAAMNLFDSGEYDDKLVSCCGGGGAYNYNPEVPCGEKSSVVCLDPSNYVNWDGMHLTEAAYSRIAYGILLGQFASSPLLSSCKI